GCCKRLQLLDRLVDHGKHHAANAVAGYSKERLVKQKIQLDKSSRTLFALFHTGVDGVELRNVFGGGPARRAGSELRLDDQPGLHQFMEGDAVPENEELHRLPGE